MRRDLFMGKLNPEKFNQRLQDLNRYTVNLLALGKEPWRFKDLEEQLNIYPQQWQADQQKQIITKMAGNMSGKTNE
jgi:hypothetical protein